MDVQRAIAGVRSIQGALRVLAMLQLTAYRFPQQAVVNNGDTFHYIVVGGGSAGSVLANRLTEDPDVKVLLVEAGGDPPIESVTPGLMTYLWNSHVDWNYTSVHDNYSARCRINKVYNLTSGKMLGGGSSINYMAYLRGDPVIYDSWASITNDDTWSFENVLPYFKKSERLEDEEVLHSRSRNLHGTKGYMGVTKQKNAKSIPFIEALQEIGQKVVLDLNGNRLGYGELMFTKSNGVRQSTAQAFLSPIINRKNLFVLKNALVTKIIFDKFKNAVGVQLINEKNEEIQVKADLEVIVSSGAINSPKLLMLSGIGPKKHLQKFQIPVVSDLPVGQNLRDHISVCLAHTLGEANNSSSPQNPHEIPIAIVNGFVSIDNTPYPNYQVLNLILTADETVIFCGFTYGFEYDICQKLYEQSKGKQVLYSVLVDVGRKSTGQVLLRSRDATESPIVELKPFSKRVDLDNKVRYIRDFLKIQDSSYLKRNKAELFRPDCVKALREGSDEYWQEYAICMSTSIFHYAGTCAMGSVLNNRLQVLGVNRLRVVDASSMPLLPTANPNPAVIMVAEKAADMIKEDNDLNCK